MATSQVYHGKQSVLQIDYPDRIQYKDVTTATNDHYAHYHQTATPDADPETSLDGVEYLNSYYQTAGVDDDTSVEISASGVGTYALHYFKIKMPTAEANITKMWLSLKGKSDSTGSVTDGWDLKLWDGSTWVSVGDTLLNIKQELTIDVTDTSDVTIAEFVCDVGGEDYVFFMAQPKGVGVDGSNASRMAVCFVDVRVWYARTIAVTKDWNVRVEMEIDELFSQDSVVRQAVVVKNVKVPCEFSRAQFDGRLITEILGSVNMDQDVDGGTSAGRSRGSIRDSSDPLTVTVRGTITHGSDSLKVRVDNVALEGINFTSDESTWIQQKFKGSGDAAYTEYAT